MTSVMEQKIVLGQFFTKEGVWLKQHIIDFIQLSKATIAYDPFAGAGDLLNAARSIGITQTVGLDIDPKLHWGKNDSLISIPHINNAILITNPPYLSNYSAARKKINEKTKHYFDNSSYDDLYLIALDRMLEAQEYVVAIIPETFINSNYRNKARLVSITVLEDNPFTDTDTPVIVACFNGIVKDFSEIKIYKNETFIDNLASIERLRLIPRKNVPMIFNDMNGWLGVRCVDTTSPRDMLKFDFKEKIPYDWDKGIKVSSRLLTLIQIDVPEEDRQRFVDSCNIILNSTREKTNDIIFSPFKGNMKDGRRRRRLDFFTCRAIVEKAYYQIVDSTLGGCINDD